MSAVHSLEIGPARLTRVPYFDIALAPDVVRLSAEELDRVPWTVPTWTTPDQQALVGQVLWVIESQGQVIVVDPCGAADGFLRTLPEAIGHQEAALAAMAEAGFPPERVDTVVLTHLDGIGMAAVVDEDGSWGPAFPSARVVLTRRELDFLAGFDDPAAPAPSGLDQLRMLADQGVVDGVGDDHRLTDEVRLVWTGGHTVGHAVVQVDADGASAVLLGHLALNPAHLVLGRCEGLHDDADRSLEITDALVGRSLAEGTVLIGPLWPEPGAARARQVDSTIELEPVG